jgi:hypothetical protein
MFPKGMSSNTWVARVAWTSAASTTFPSPGTNHMGLGAVTDAGDTVTGFAADGSRCDRAIRDRPAVTAGDGRCSSFW